MAYYTNWSGMEIEAIPWYITHVSYAFAKLLPDGTVTNNEPVDIGQSAGCNADGLYYKLYRLKEQRPYLKTILSVGGWTYRDDFLPVLSDPVKRTRFVNSAVRLALDYGFDGIDADYEYPNTVEEGKLYTLMLKLIREKLDAAGRSDRKKYYVTSAIPSSKYLLTNFLLSQSRLYVDFFNLMAYDASVGVAKATHQSPLYPNPKDINSGNTVDTVVSFMMSQGVKADQIVLGMPLYAHQYKVASNDINKGLFSVKTNTVDTWLTNKDVYGLKQSGKYTEYFDSVSQVPYLYNAADGLFVTFDNIKSVVKKMKYVNARGLRGAFFWEINQDYLIDHLDVAILPTAQEHMSGLVYYSSSKICSPTSKFCNIKCK